MSPILPMEALVLSLQQDEPVIIPTDTVPGLATRPCAAQKIWTLKQRPRQKPLILMGADLAQLEQALASPWLPEWHEEAERVWPGPVTLVLPMAGPICEALNPGGASLGLRVPACARTQELLRHAGPMATTSVNRSGEAPALTAEEASLLFPEIPLLGPLPWPPNSGIPSQVRAWSDGGWSVLRVQPPNMD